MKNAFLHIYSCITEHKKGEEKKAVIHGQLTEFENSSTFTN